MPQTATWTILGSGGGAATADRASSGYLLETPQESIMFDCGDGVTGSFLRCGKRYEDIDAVLISHTHPDHFCGLPFFLQQLYLVRRRGELLVYLPGEAVAGLKTFLDLNYLFIEHFGFSVRFLAFADNQKITFNDLSIIPRANTHLTAHRGQPWMAGLDNRGECFSFEIEYRTMRMAYSSDIGSLDDLHFCAGCHTLVVETTHVPLPELFARAEKWGVRRIVLTHLGPEFAPDFAARAASRFHGKTIIAADGLVISLSE